MTPAEVTAAYREQGYDFVSLTDHFLPKARFANSHAAGDFITISDTATFHTDDFVTIFGAEVHGPAMENGELWHIVAVGLPLDFLSLQPDETGIEVARRAREAGAWVALAHPAWNSVSYADAEQLVGIIDAVEIYNHACAIHINRGDGWYMLDLLSQHGHRLDAYAADDAHFQIPGRPDGFGGWVMVKADALSSDALLQAIKDGAYYSSTGVALHDVRLDGDILTVASDPVERYLVSGNGARFERINGEALTDGTLNVAKFREHGWFRLTAFAADGAIAWTNPIHFDTIGE
jgi:hypothetical protein